ncbi:MAG: DUF4148 domain-containing protein [Pseudomonadota bacterium]
MLIRKTAIALALVGASITAAFANNGSSVVGGEKGFEFHNTPSLKSRADVQSELFASRKNPTIADGGKSLAGGALYVFPQHSYVFKDGKPVHADTLNHDTPRSSLTMTSDERQAQIRLQGL